MIHLLICPEFPPGAGGGIGTYASNIAQILAQRGDTVHVIGPLVKQAREPREQAQDGRLIIHRFESAGDRNTHPSQAFAWEAARLAEHLVETAGIEIIEAQEYQAPLYYFLKRRAEGFGPATKPPVVVHLHSPTELIARHNDWPLERPDLRSAAQREEYCIRSADALLSPSRLLAGAVEERYGLEAASVKVIPYPLGEVEELPRDPRVWSAGSILFMGRLEPRKGALEWIEAARQAATEHPRLIFDFVGCNVLGPNRVVGWRRLQERIPVRQLRNFHFHGYQPHERALRCLGRARIARKCVIEASSATGIPRVTVCEADSRRTVCPFRRPARISLWSTIPAIRRVSLTSS